MKYGWQDQKVHKQEIMASAIHSYIRLLFSTIMHLLMSTCLLSVVYGRYSAQVVSCHNGLDLGLSILIQSHYYWLFLHPSKSKRRDV